MLEEVLKAPIVLRRSLANMDSPLMSICMSWLPVKQEELISTNEHFIFILIGVY